MLPVECDDVDVKIVVLDVGGELLELRDEGLAVTAPRRVKHSQSRFRDIFPQADSSFKTKVAILQQKDLRVLAELIVLCDRERQQEEEAGNDLFHREGAGQA